MLDYANVGDFVSELEEYPVRDNEDPPSPVYFRVVHWVPGGGVEDAGCAGAGSASQNVRLHGGVECTRRNIVRQHSCAAQEI